MHPPENAAGGQNVAPVAETAPNRFRALREMLRARADTEHEVSINRIGITLVVVLNWTIAAEYGSTTAIDALIKMAPALAIFGGIGVMLLAHLLKYPGVSHARRCIAVPLDIFGLSFSIWLSGDSGAMLYPIYLWAILGNGFRYGLYYMFGAVVVSVASFSWVIIETPFWQRHIDIAAGLSLGLVIIPLYAATLIRKLSAATRAAEAANRSKSMFLASVSHELRTPLNAIVGLSDLLVGSPLEPDQAEMVRTIGRSGRSLTSLINSILDVARMEIGRLPAKKEEVDLCAFLADTRALLAVQAKKKDLQISVSVAPGTPQRILCNRGHIEEILVNLGSNAVKFTHQGFVAISVAPLARDGDLQRLRFEVRDSGIGIAEDARERIFEQFSQADESIIDQYGGTGLGLSIVKQLVEGSGGRIGVESSLSAGSTFWFEIDCKVVQADAIDRIAHPVCLISTDMDIRAAFAAACDNLRCFDVAADALAALESVNEPSGRKPLVVLDQALGASGLETALEWFGENSDGGAWPLVRLGNLRAGADTGAAEYRFATWLRRQSVREDIVSALAIAEKLCIREGSKTDGAAISGGYLDILVAEDNRTNQLVIRKILENAGHRVTVAENGEQALEQLGVKSFDLVLMDVNMPVLNGIEAAKLARFVVLDGPRVPIVALTADATEETRNRCLEAGMDDCLTKPIERVRLLAWLARFQESIVRKTPQDEEIATHPAADAVAEAVDPAEPIDARTLEDLETLGGRDFVNQIVDQFVQDAASVLRELSQAVAAGDAHAFREQAHALRSCAANVGARKVYELCLEWRAIDTAEVAVRGEAHMRQLEAEFSRARTALGARPGVVEAA